MSENIIKKSQPKKDIGNLNNKDFGIELDPNNDLCLSESGDRGQEAFYKGSKMNYVDYISEVGNRIKKGKEGKGMSNIGLFGGLDFDENGKIIKS